MIKVKNVHCDDCGHKGYAVAKEMYPALTDKDGNTVVEYESLVAYCPECRKIMYIDEIAKENSKRLNDAIRAKFGLVSFEDTLKLPRRYAVPREFMTKILDLDESVWDGAAPTDDESDRIKMALADPKYFIEQLDKAKDVMPKAKYEKVRKRAARMTDH